MAFRIRPSRAVDDELRRVLQEQIDRAVKAAADDPPHEAIHEIRRRCKKARAALRIARPALPGAFARENTSFRDTARLISHLRDTEAVLEALEQLAESDAGQEQAEAIHTALESLRQRQRKAATPAELRAGVDQAAEQLAAARPRMAELPIKGDGFEIIAGGLRRTYRDARRAMRQARKASKGGPSAAATEALHTWRKRIKDHRYQMHMLRGLWPAAMEARVHELRRLSDLLGKDQDLTAVLAILHERADGGGEGDGGGGQVDVKAIEPVISQQREELIAAAWPLGARLLVEKPDAFQDRMRRLWAAADS